MKKTFFAATVLLLGASALLETETQFLSASLFNTPQFQEVEYSGSGMSGTGKVADSKRSFSDFLFSKTEKVEPEELEEVVSEVKEERVIPSEADVFNYPDREACWEANGSYIRGIDTNRTRICVKPYSDAGKNCTDSDQCEGRCLGLQDEETEEYNGFCQNNNNPFGCFPVMTEGKSEPTEVCVTEWEGEE